MQTILSTHHFSFSEHKPPSFNEGASCIAISLHEIKTSMIKKIAASSFKELSVSFILTGLTCFFVASPAIPTLLITTIGILALNLFMRSMTGYLTYKLERAKREPSDKEDVESLQFAHSFLQYLCPISFTILDITTRDVLVHESGHALTAMALYQNARPTIEVFPLEGGVTRYSAGPLTKLGEFFGRKISGVIVSGAGAAFSILFATVNIGLAHHFKQDHPELHRYLLCAAISSIAQHVFYALSALWEKRPSSGHDFVKLWRVGGIHPVISVICMVALPLIVKTTLFTIEHCRSLPVE
jgi:hypothetical protein